MASKTELAAYKILDQFDLPIIYGEDYLDGTYMDKSGTVLRAKSDAQVYGIHIEIKCCMLNSKTSKEKADKALARVDPARYAASPTYFQILNQWNHSACKVSLTQKAMGTNRLLVFFVEEPKKTKDCNTPYLLEKYEIEYCTPETVRFALAQAIFANMPPSPPREDGWANFHNIDTLVPLKSGKKTCFTSSLDIWIQEKFLRSQSALFIYSENH